jgi:diaminopimelate decarboxylase
MSGFAYRHGVLAAEGVALPEIAASVGTPFYCYSRAAIVGAYRRLADALAGLDVAIHFAVKANGNLAVLDVLAREGAGADVVSGGELARALAAGIPPDRIVFSGVGKTRTELDAAIAAGIGQINVESLPELAALEEAAAAARRRVPVAIRVNPDVDARTHAKITTGRRENKFGIDADRAGAGFAAARALPHLVPVGVAVHIGSQLTELAPFRDAFVRVAALIAALRAEGHGVERLDLGGGLGVAYRQGSGAPDIAAYAGIIAETVGGLGCRLMVEPGRLIVAAAGVLVAKVVFVKEASGRRFLILDAGMNDLMRPALYDAWHDIVPVREPPAGAPALAFDVVGPVCESTDTFAVQRALPPVAEGDLLAFTDAGAYGAVMASSYCGRPLVPEVMVNQSSFAVVRKRPTFEEMVALETVPEWRT